MALSFVRTDKNKSVRLSRKEDYIKKKRPVTLKMN